MTINRQLIKTHISDYFFSIIKQMLSKYKKHKYLFLIIIFVVLLISTLTLYFLRQSSITGYPGVSCGGDWSYDVVCPVGTYCKSLNQGPLAGGICTPLGK